MSESVRVRSIPSCDFCREDGRQTPAFAYAKLPFGHPANLCARHFTFFGCQLGTGHGQQYILEPKASER